MELQIDSFLKHKDLIITETFPICLYVIHKANRKDLLGTSVADEVKVDMFVWDTEIMGQILTMMISAKNESPEKKKMIFMKYW